MDNVLRFNEMLEGATMRSGSHKLRKRNRLAINTGDYLASVVCGSDVSVSSPSEGVILSKRLETMGSHTQSIFLHSEKCPSAAHLNDLDRDALSQKVQEPLQSKCYDHDEPKDAASASTP